METDLEDGKHEIKHVKYRWEIDLVSRPVDAELLVNTYIWKWL